MRGGLRLVESIEDSVNVTDDLSKARKTARCLWDKLEIYRSWLEFDLQKKAREGKTSRDILEWLSKEAILIMYASKNRSPTYSSHKYIAANSMYRISQTILLHYDEQENWPIDEDIFKRIEIITAGLLWGCFTNLPRVITLKCHHDAMEKRGESIRSAAELLGESKQILKKFKARQLPGIDVDSMGYIDEWHEFLKSRRSSDHASSSRTERASSSHDSYILNVG